LKGIFRVCPRSRKKDLAIGASAAPWLVNNDTGDAQPGRPTMKGFSGLRTASFRQNELASPGVLQAVDLAVVFDRHGLLPAQQGLAAHGRLGLRRCPARGGLATQAAVLLKGAFVG
jgi:hypothetical protein